MHNILILFAIAVGSAISTSAFSASLYKWVDKDGNTHFSQTPPPQAESTADIDQVQLRNNRVIKPRKEGRDWYCGNDRLSNSFGDRPAIRIANLEQYIIDRRREMESMKERRMEAVNRSYRYRQSSLNQSDELRRYDTDIDEEQCKLEWAQGELAALGDERSKITDRIQTVQDGIAEIEQRKIARCGIDNRTGVIIVDDEYRAYQECTKPYDREIDKLRRELKNAERDQKIVDGG
jgi:hypothetical protein